MFENGGHIHVYSPRAGVDNPLGSNFFHEQYYSVDLVLCLTAEVRKLNVVAQKRSGRPRKSWDEVIKNDRKKLDMGFSDPQNRSEWRGRFRERLVNK